MATIDEMLKLSRPYKGRKYENMTILQRLRCDLLAEAADYDHVHMHERNPQKADNYVADELVTIAQNYAWQYRKHHEIATLNALLTAGHGGGNWRRLIIVEISKREAELKEYLQQYKNMELQ